jgi:arylformamidase
VCGTTGTYIESPYHFHADRAALVELPLQWLVNVPIVVIRADRGHVRLAHTGWSRHWAPRFVRFDDVFLSDDAADRLLEANVAIVGIDSPNIEDPNDPPRATHHGLLGADIPFIEHLTNLKDVPDEGGRLIALPRPVRRLASFPVRSVATHHGRNYPGSLSA